MSDELTNLCSDSSGGHSGVIPGSLQNHSWGHSRVIPGSFRDHSGVILGSFRRHFGIMSCHFGIIPGFAGFSTSSVPAPRRARAQIRLAAPDAPVADPGPLFPLEEPSSETLLGNSRMKFVAAVRGLWP